MRGRGKRKAPSPAPFAVAQLRPGVLTPQLERTSVVPHVARDVRGTRAERQAHDLRVGERALRLTGQLDSQALLAGARELDADRPDQPLAGEELRAALAGFVAADDDAQPLGSDGAESLLGHAHLDVRSCR